MVLGNAPSITKPTTLNPKPCIQEIPRRGPVPNRSSSSEPEVERRGDRGHGFLHAMVLIKNPCLQEAQGKGSRVAAEWIFRSRHLTGTVLIGRSTRSTGLAQSLELG